MCKSGKRDSNSRPQPWQGCALPTELFPRYNGCKVRLLACNGQRFLHNLIHKCFLLFATKDLNRTFFCRADISFFLYKGCCNQRTGAFLHLLIKVKGHRCFRKTEEMCGNHCFFLFNTTETFSKGRCLLPSLIGCSVQPH